MFYLTQVCNVTPPKQEKIQTKNFQLPCEQATVLNTFHLQFYESSVGAAQSSAVYLLVCGFVCFTTKGP